MCIWNLLFCHQMASTGGASVPQQAMLLLLFNKQSMPHTLSWRTVACLCVISCAHIYIYICIYGCYKRIYNTLL